MQNLSDDLTQSGSIPSYACVRLTCSLISRSGRMGQLIYCR